MVERLTHAYDGPLAVFLIGLRIHQPWRVGVVGQALRAMPRMIVELEQNRAAAERGEAESLGYLGSRSRISIARSNALSSLWGMRANLSSRPGFGPCAWPSRSCP